MASEASCVYILTGQKFINNGKKWSIQVSFGKSEVETFWGFSKTVSQIASTFLRITLMPLSVCQLCYQRSCSFAAAEIVLVLINAQRQHLQEQHQKRNSIQLTVLVSFSFGFVNWTLYWRSPCPGICFKGDHSTKHPSSVMLLTLGAAKMKKKKCIFRPR